MALFSFMKKREVPPEIFAIAPGEIYQAGVANLRDIIAPAALEVNPNFVRIGEKLVRTIFVFSYPRFLSTNWFSPVINLDKVFDIALHINPVDTAIILRQLRKQVARVQSQISIREEKGLVRDPVLDTAYRDLETLRDKLQQAQERLFNFGLYLSLYGETPEELDRLENEVRSVLEARIVYVKPALFQQEQGFNSTLPLNMDDLGIYSYLNSGPISSTFPFISFDLTSNRGILYGINRHNNSLILFDRWSMPNSNSVTFAVSGAGKSIVGSEPVLVRRNGVPELVPIGPVVEDLIRKRGITYRDEELEGVFDPGVEVYSFGRTLAGRWSRVSVAARKEAPAELYRFTTKSGRTITTTADHNLMVLRDGRLIAAKGDEVRVGEHVPLPRHVAAPPEREIPLNLITLLGRSPRIYVRGGERVLREHYPKLKAIVIDERYDRYLYRYRDGRAIPIAYFCKLLARLGLAAEGELLRELRLSSSRRRGGSLPAELIVPPALVKLLGYVTAEGTLTANAILISNQDAAVRADIRRATGEIGASAFETPSGIVIAERVFVELFRQLGAGGYSHEKRVPPFLFGAPRTLIASYLAAYCEGDGGVERSSITATSKSRHLISDLAYLLYYFGIVARISPRKKRLPRNGRQRIYWLLTISGQEHLSRFQEHIGFVSQRKKERLARARGENNTNVDIVPGIQPLLEKVYRLGTPLLQAVPNFAQLRAGAYQPSPQNLLKLVGEIETRIAVFRRRATAYASLGSLPPLDDVIQTGRSDAAANRSLWQTLGQSWWLMKNRAVQPRTGNVLKAIGVLGGTAPVLGELKTLIHTGCKELGLAIAEHRGSLQSALMARPLANTRYEILQAAAAACGERCRELTARLPEIEEILDTLKTLARADLFWDPIASIAVLRNKEPYVYDLTVDDEVFLAGSGGLFIHNSYATKLEILRSLMLGAEVIVIDPEREYQYLAETVGGAYFNISLTSQNHINPFDLPKPREDESPADVLRSNIINLIGFFRILLGGLSPQEDAILDRAITETYAARDITPEADFSGAVPPTLSDLELVLAATEGGEELAMRLKKYTQGTWAGFINQHSNLDIKNRLVVFSVRDMEEELRPVAMYIVLHYIWNLVRSELKRRLLVVDEAWWLMRSEDGASFLYGVAKRARKYYLGLCTITQDVADFMGSPYGRPIVTNSSIQLLLKQSPATIRSVIETFNLTQEEKFLLLESEVGEGIFFAGLKHVAIKVIASYTEDQVITSDPEQLMMIKKAKQEFSKLRRAEEEPVVR